MKVPKYNPINLMGDNRIVAGLNLGAMWDDHELIQDGLQRVVGYWTSGAARPHIDSQFSFDDAREAHGRLENAKNMGKVILVP